MRARASLVAAVVAVAGLLALGPGCAQILGLDERRFEPTLADGGGTDGTGRDGQQSDGPTPADAEQSDGLPQADAPGPDAEGDARPLRDAMHDVQSDVQIDASHARCPEECTDSTSTCAAGGCVASPPSCATLEPSCGPFGTWGCCDWELVPGGVFYYHCQPNPPRPSCEHSVASFGLDLYEVTVGRFRAFVEAGQGTQANPPAAGAGANPLVPDSGWDPAWNASLVADTETLKQALKCDWKVTTWTDSPEGNERRPVNCVSWYEAFAFCAWDGGRLPGFFEWNYASMGGSEERMYPWGTSAIDDSYASYYGNMLWDQCLGDGVPGCDLTDLIYVGSKPRGNGKWGQADLVGNVWEWVSDVSSTTWRFMLGGSLVIDQYYLRSEWNSATVDAAVRGYDQGLRCARSAP
jgi:formylglycine-generating enzyme